MAEFWSPTGLQHARTGMDGRALPVRAPRRRPPRTTGLGSISRNDHGRRGVRDHRCRRLPASRSRRLTRRYSLDRCSSPQRVAGGGTNPYTRNGRAGKAGRHFADRCLKGASNGWFFRSWRPRRLAAVPSRSWSGGRHLCGARCSCSSLCSCLSWHRSSQPASWWPVLGAITAAALAPWILLLLCPIWADLNERCLGRLPKEVKICGHDDSSRGRGTAGGVSRQ
jgi:hypothetical protein